MADSSTLTAPAQEVDSAAVTHPLQRRGGPTDRGIRVTAGPTSRHVPGTPQQDGDRPASSSSRGSYGGSATSSGPGLRVSGKPSRAEGLLAKVCDWADGGYAPRPSAGAGAAARRGSSAAGDFTSTAEDPDRRRLRDGGTAGPASSRRPTLEQQWRAECLTAARARDLSHVADMRLVELLPGGLHRAGHAVVAVEGAHYRRKLASREDVLLHCVLEAEKLGGRPFVVLYFHADVRLPLLPDSEWFTELHAALPPGHRAALQALYVVHPNFLLRSWAVMLRMQEPDVWHKAVYCERLRDLLADFHPDVLRHVSQHVRDKDARLLGR